MINGDMINNIWKQLLALLKNDIKIASENKKPLLILSLESHFGLREFIGKCLLAHAATMLGIKHHCLERRPGYTAETLDITLEKDDIDLFSYFLSKMDIYLSEIDNPSESVQLEKLFDKKPKSFSREEGEILIKNVNAELNIRNHTMADNLLTTGIPAILYNGLGHTEGLYNLLNKYFHIVMFDVSNISNKNRIEYEENFYKETGCFIDEFDLSSAFIRKGLENKMIRSIKIPIKESWKIQNVVNKTLTTTLQNDDINPSKALKVAKGYEVYAMVLIWLRNFFIQKEADIFLSVTHAFCETRLNQPLLWHMSFKKQKEDSDWIKEFNDKSLYKQWEKRYNIVHPNLEQAGYGPGTLVLSIKKPS